MAAMVGDNYWIVVGPVVFLLTLLWIGMVLWAARRERQGKSRATRVEASHRGSVSGGIIEGSPGSAEPAR
jgi:hypothetical protein